MYPEKQVGAINVGNRLQAHVQLEKDGGGSTEQRWMETSNRRPLIVNGLKRNNTS